MGDASNAVLIGTVLEPLILKSAGIAYIHYLSFMLCFAALVVERKVLKPDPSREEAITILISDVIYGLAGLTLLISGILRVLYFGQGSQFYTENTLFWVKVGIFLVVGLVSLYPTINYLLWIIPLRKGEVPKLSEKLFKRLGLILNFELIGFASIPLLATFMARGIGLVDL